MSLEPHLRHTLDGLPDRIREEASRQIAAALADLTKALDAQQTAAVAEAVERTRAEAEQDASHRLAEAVAAAEERGRERGRNDGLAEAVAAAEERGRERGRIDGLAEGRSEGRQSGWEAGAKAGREAGSKEGMARLATSLRRIDAASSLTGILDELLAGVASEASRAAIVLVKGDRLHMWRFHGFDVATVAGLDVSVDEGGFMAEAVQSATPTWAGGGPHGRFPFLARATDCAIALPVVLGSSTVVAVLYADQTQTAQAEGAGEAADKKGSDDRRTAWAAALEALVRHAARYLEVVTAFRTARVFGNEAVRTGGAAGRPASPEAERADEAARRYARLLVGEIKLYHEAAIVAGRRERDLAERLSSEIAHARAMYQERVSPELRRETDYFDEELVRTLAGGDASLLRQAT
jgi:flagellar biosynthesis/type III secretory pathway protein FliH